MSHTIHPDWAYDKCKTKPPPTEPGPRPRRLLSIRNNLNRILANRQIPRSPRHQDPNRGAGFPSQRTRGEDRTRNLSAYDGIGLVIDSADGKLYTLTLKDEILPNRSDGREQRTISWEFDFRVEGRRSIFVKWSDFRPTYRGRNLDDDEPLDLKRVKRFEIMTRSFFGDQEGAFALNLVSIVALRTTRYLDEPDDECISDFLYEKVAAEGPSSRQAGERQGWFSWLTSCLL